MKFIKNPDNVDIAAKSIDIRTMESLDNRGLCIQIRHNGDKRLFELANEVASKIVKALNEEDDTLDKLRELNSGANPEIIDVDCIKEVDKDWLTDYGYAYVRGLCK